MQKFMMPKTNSPTKHVIDNYYQQFNQQQHQIMKVIIMCLSVGSSICPGGCPLLCSKNLIYYYYYYYFGWVVKHKIWSNFVWEFFLLYCKEKIKGKLCFFQQKFTTFVKSKNWKKWNEKKRNPINHQHFNVQ